MNRHRHHETGRDIAAVALPILRGEAPPRVLEEDSERILSGLLRAGLSALALSPMRRAGAPAGLVASLEGERNKQRAELALLHDRMGRFADLMSGAGVPFIVHKGAALATLLYDPPDLRPMVDVDILLRREDWPAARDVLRREGFHLPSESDETYWLANYFNMPVSTPDARPVSFDIHWALNQKIRYGVDEEAIRRRAVPFTLEGREYLRLGNEDLLLSLVLHLAYHYFEARLLWLHDIHRIAVAVRLDWDLVVKRSRLWRMAAVLGLALGFVEKVIPGSVPERILRETLPGRLRRAALAPLRSSEPARLFRGDDRRVLQFIQGLLVMDSPWTAARFGADKVLRRLRFLGARPRLR